MSVNDPIQFDTSQTKFTLMVYMAGSNLESEGSAASADLEEMRCAIPSDGSLRIVVMPSGAQKWHCDVVDDATNIYELTPDGLHVLEEGPLVSMGDSNTLLHLLTYAYVRYPAERYALVLWNHGAGPMMGACFDELFKLEDSMDSLTLPELCCALDASPFSHEKLSWIGFDACMMASLETANALKPYADYLVASQEPESKEGWDYRFLHALAYRETLDGTRDILEAYEDSTKSATRSATLSCTDLSSIAPLVEELSSILGKVHVSKDSFETYASCRSSSCHIGGSIPYDYDLVDLSDFLRNLANTGEVKAEDAFKLIDDVVVYNYANRSRHCGLSLYFPYANKARYASPWASYSRTLLDVAGYQEFLSGYASCWMEQSLASWKIMHTPEVNEDYPNRIMLQLSNEQASQLDKARLVVVSQKGPGLYSFAYANDAVDITPQGMLYSEYYNEALYCVDKDGVPRTGALSFEKMDGDILLPAKLYRMKPAEMKLVRIAFHRNEQSAWSLANVFEEDETGQLAGKTTLDLSDWDYVSFEDRARTRVVSTDGQCPAYDDWHYGTLISGYELKTEELGGLQVLRLQDADLHYAFFEMTDFHGTTVSSELVPLPNDNRLPLEVSIKELVNSPIVTVSLAEASMVLGNDPSLQLDYSITNNASQTIAVDMSEFRFDATTYDGGFFGSLCYVAPGERKTTRIHMDVDTFQQLGIVRFKKLDTTIEIYSVGDDFDQNSPIMEEHVVSIPLHVELSAM